MDAPPRHLQYHRLQLRRFQPLRLLRPRQRHPLTLPGCRSALVAAKGSQIALDMLWHEDCLKCGCCDCRLGEVGSTLYTKANLILCKRDYLRLFGNTGYCAACSKVIPAFEMVMRARNNVYHLECFACQQCNHRYVRENRKRIRIDAVNRWFCSLFAEDVSQIL
ncbi:hypothetical protein J437_LFUL015006 [Ladona fulva]|uniref:LIM zinc-binding domain-containing protein n=1 Tax=Ladona fulva TaxID=123851 RepID=A0A8K0KIE5_LADFU|nr:hypothetical protein J437_LFUL015006 [Ladona fulva]